MESPHSKNSPLRAFPSSIYQILFPALAALSFWLCPWATHAGQVLSGGGLMLVEEGGAIAPGNLAASGTAFAKDLLPGYPASHTIPNLNDQAFGNNESWIGDSAGTFAGVSFGATPVPVSSIAFGRDNTGVLTDRTQGIYTLQYTTVANPNASTPEASWLTIGTLDYQSAGGTNYSFPSRRHRYKFNAVAATGIRLLVPSGGLATGTCIDELEAYSGVVVNTTADELDSPAGPNISLREAVRDAASGDTIVFAPALSGQTITLTTGNSIAIAKNLTIDASSLAAGITIDGGTGTNRIFYLDSGSLSLRNLNLTGGNGTGNSVSSAGGAIAATSGTSLNLTRCALYGNSSSVLGGAIHSNGAVSLESCTLSGNSVAGVGIGMGGAIHNSGGSLSLVHCTITGNSSDSQGGGIMVNSTPTLKGNIIAGNSASSGPDMYFTAGFTPPAVNYIGNPAGSGLSAGPMVMTTAANGAILLSALGNHGGGTRTVRLLPGSPARNAATVLSPALTADQRGFPVVGTPDLGACETQIGSIANQNINEDSNTGAVAFSVGTAGTITATSDNPAVVANAGIVLGGSGANRTVTINPVANASGTAIITLSDSLTGEMQLFTVTVNSVNDAPTFTIGANQTLVQNSPAQSITGWATGFSPGPSDESGQSVLSYNVSNNNNALFAVQPAIATNGTLTFTPATNAAGIATVTARVQDNGGTANGGVDTSTAQTFTITITPVVTTTADSGAGSLRAALANAASIPGANSITFAASLSGQTITLASEIRVIDTSAVTLDATSLPAGVTISGGGVCRIFYVQHPSSLSLNGITLTGGTGTSLFSNGYGGAIYNLAILSLNRCTLSGNSSTFQGGAIYSSAQASSPSVILTNCTFTGNISADGGAITNGGNSVATLRHCTISSNTGTAGIGGIRADHTVNLTACIVAGNTGLSGFENMGGANWSSTNSIVSGNPQLGPLADNGGPTRTMALLAGSPALDFNNTPVPGVDTDQRGLPRIREGDGTGSIYSDAGALEMQTPPAAGAEQLRVTTTADENDATGTLGAGLSLREAIRLVAAGRTIGFDAPLNGQTITLTAGTEIAFGKSLTIDASSLAAGITINGGPGTNRIFGISGGSVSMLGLTLTGGNGGGASANGTGGAVWLTGSLNMTRCTLAGNSATSSGSAIYFESGASALTLTQCTLAGNSCLGSGSGGAIYLGFGSATLTHCTVSTNSSTSNCAGISSFMGNLTLINTIVAANQGGSNGSDLTLSSGAGQATYTRSGANIVQSVSGSFISSGPAAINTSPLLAPLGDYGGPTHTMALLPGSPARNAAVGSAITSDQRGFPVVGTPDIGAYEAGTFASFDTWAWETKGSLLDFKADEENDGTSNGLEYATRRNPLLGDAPLAPELTPEAGGGHGFQFRYQKDARDLRYIVQRSTELGAGTGWTEIYRLDTRTGIIIETGVTGDENPATGLIEITDPTSVPKSFWRLVVERLP